MKLELYEARGNLDRIEGSLLDVNEKIKKMTDVSPNSSVTVEKLRDKPGMHTWEYVIETILPNDDVAFVVLRSNKRQIALMSKDKNITGSTDRYLMIWSNYAYTIPEIKDMISEDRYIYTESSYNMQTKMWKTVDAYIKHTNGKKNWDIIVVHKDKTLDSLKQSRADARKGMEIKPNNKREYNDYISGLKKDLAVRLKTYSENKLVNATTIDEVKSLISNGVILPKKIKIAGVIYDYGGVENLNDMENNITFSSTYQCSDEQLKRFNSDISYLKFVYRTEGLTRLILADVLFKPRGYSSATISFNKGVNEIINYKKNHQ